MNDLHFYAPKPPKPPILPRNWVLMIVVVILFSLAVIRTIYGIR